MQGPSSRCNKISPLPFNKRQCPSMSYENLFSAIQRKDEKDFLFLRHIDQTDLVFQGPDFNFNLVSLLQSLVIPFFLED